MTEEMCAYHPDTPMLAKCRTCSKNICNYDIHISEAGLKGNKGKELQLLDLRFNMCPECSYKVATRKIKNSRNINLAFLAVVFFVIAGYLNSIDNSGVLFFGGLVALYFLVYRSMQNASRELAKQNYRLKTFMEGLDIQPTELQEEN